MLYLQQFDITGFNMYHEDNFSTNCWPDLLQYLPLRRLRPFLHQDGSKLVHVRPSYCHLAFVVEWLKLEIPHHTLSGDSCILVH